MSNAKRRHRRRRRLKRQDAKYSALLKELTGYANWVSSFTAEDARVEEISLRASPLLMMVTGIYRHGSASTET